MLQSYQNIVKRMFSIQQDEPLNEEDEYQEHNEEQAHKQHHHDSVSTEYLVHNWLEALFAWFQVIVLWHEPHLSAFAISGLLSSFLFLTYFAPRFYTTIMLALFIYNLNKFWFRHVWPEIRVPPSGDREEEMRLDVDRWTYLHPQLMTLKELKYHFRNLIIICEGHLLRQLQLRHQNPARFCSRICLILFCTGYLGKTISGLTLTFCALVTIVAAPGIYAHLLPEQYKQWLRQQYLSMIAANDERIHDSHLSPVKSGSEEEGDAELLKPAMTLKSKEKIANSVATTMKSIESLFGNLTKKKHSVVEAATTSTSQIRAKLQPESTEQPQQQPASSNVLSNLREDGAKVLYNLIDVTLMAAAGKERHRSGSAGSHEESEGENDIDKREEAADRAAKQSSSKESSATESISLLDNEDEQQDEGFVML